MTIFPQCFDCRHFHKGTPPELPYTCDAFREAIPDTILLARHDHTKPFEGDNGIRFEAIPDVSGKVLRIDSSH